VVHEIPREPFDRGRIPARGYVGHIVLHQVGDHGDAVVAFAAGSLLMGAGTRIVLDCLVVLIVVIVRDIHWRDAAQRVRGASG